MKKFNFDRDFESVYLRESALKKIKFNDLHEKFFNNPETRKVMKYIANYHWMKNSYYWTKIGVDKDELLSMVRIYTFYYIGKNFNESAFNYKNMMRFVGQRLEYYGECFYRKYDMSEIISEYVPVNFDSETLDIPNPLPNNDGEQNKRFSERMSKKTRNFLMAKLSKNLKDYENTLVYYAISKHVGEDVRKKAKKLCKMYGINYKDIAKEKFLNKDFDLHYILD